LSFRLSAEAERSGQRDFFGRNQHALKADLAALLVPVNPDPIARPYRAEELDGSDLARLCDGIVTGNRIEHGVKRQGAGNDRIAGEVSGGCRMIAGEARFK
jgi:hypothetical protein